MTCSTGSKRSCRRGNANTPARAPQRNPAVAEELARSRARLVAVVEAILVAREREHGSHRAEALVASLDGLLLTAFQKPAGQRREFLSESLRLVLHALTEPDA